MHTSKKEGGNKHMRETELFHWTLNYPTEKDPRPARILTLAGNMLPDDIIEYFKTNKILFNAETDLCKGGGILCLSKEIFKEYTYFLHLGRSFWKLEDKQITLNILYQLAMFYLGYEHITPSSSESSKLNEKQQAEVVKLMNEWIYRRQKNIKAS
jgi:hypothetical protein